MSIQRLGDHLLAASSELTYRHRGAAITSWRARAWMSESFTGARENAGSRERFADESAEPSRRGCSCDALAQISGSIAGGSGL
jgi:hypothetical protein